ncbi:NosD domain-containing protein [Methanosarcina sp. T3]|uniref:NosD domain-containing protein n=1 Tax=Methanosarcina sp. T3 TaxID=3439062 RepID=UPI003F859D36
MLYVGAGGGGNYTTIQAAVNNATSGDTIIVYPGTYTEVIDVDVANLTIRSLSGNPEDTIVKTLSPSHNFKVIANNVTISGFKIIGEGYYTGVFITGVSGVNITNNKFSGNDCAIQVQSSGGCNLINNTVFGSTSYGFHLSSSSNCILANNTISNTDAEGFYLDNSENCNLTNNTISNTYYEGIYLYYSGSCNLANNKISDTDAEGFYLYNSGNCTLIDNIISNTDEDGFCLYYSENCNLTNNTISNTYYEGIYLYYSGSCNLANNKISDTDEEGFYLYNSGNCTLINNIISNTEDEGFYLDYSESCNLTNNTILNSGYDSIYLYNSNSCNLTDNIVSDSYDDGITLYYSENCNLSGNTISNLYDDGILLYYAGSSILTNNTVSNVDYGIYLEYSENSTLKNSNVSSAYCGVCLYYSENSTLTNSNVSNSYYGIYIEDSDGTVMRNNTVSSGEYGLKLDNVKNCTLEDNIMSGNRYNFGFSVDDYDFFNNTGNIIDTSNLVDGKPIYFLEGDPAPSIGSDAGAIYCINCGDVEIKDVVLQNVTNGISLYNTSADLANNTINNTEIGIGLAYLQDVSISDSKVENSNYGIGLLYTANVTIADNSVRNSIDGVYMYASENCTFTDNYVQNSIREHKYSTVSSNLVKGEENTLISDNSLRTSNLVGDMEESGCGIMFAYCRNFRLGNNVVDQASNFGILLSECQDVVLVKNSVLNIGDVGIYSYNSSDVDILNNTVQNVTGTSLMFSSGLSKSSLTNSNGVGILSEYTQSLRVENNTIDQIDNTGILLDECQDIEFVNNSVQNTGYVGIYLDGSSGVDLLDNEVQNVTYRPLLYDSGLKESTLTSSNLVQRSRPSGVGVLSEYSQDLRFENNIIGQIDCIGILLGGCQDAELVGNSVRDAGYMGIYTAGSSGVELLENTVQNVTGEYELYRSGNLPFVSSPLVGDNPGISGYGIGLDYSEDFKLEGNTVKDSSQVWGIYLYEPVNATLESNYIESCKIGLASYDGYNCSISDCSATNCSSGGILIENFQESMGAEYTVTGCTVDGSDIGLLVTGESILADNILSGNSYGIVLYDANNSLIYGNTMVENSLAGLTLDLDRTEIVSRIGLVGSMESPESGNNTIYNNYFNNVNNTLIYSEANNTWNTSKTSGESIVGGPYLGGNYWANPSGTGFSENCTDADRDGIADSSYEIVNGTFDYLPLTEIPSTTTTKHKSSPNYIPSSGSSTGVTGIDSAQKRVAAGSRATFTFNNPASGIMGLSFTSQQYSGNVIVRIEALDSGSSGNVPGGEVYRLMNILVGNERFESGDNINGASLNFRVSKSWVEENNIDVSSITINRFHDDKWNALATEMAYEDEEYYYFTAETPGFSKYAITGDKLGDVVIAPAEEEETGTVTGEEQTGDVEKSTPGFESNFAVLGILASVFFAKRRILK